MNSSPRVRHSILCDKTFGTISLLCPGQNSHRLSCIYLLPFPIYLYHKMTWFLCRAGAKLLSLLWLKYPISWDYDNVEMSAHSFTELHLFIWLVFTRYSHTLEGLGETHERRHMPIRLLASLKLDINSLRSYNYETRHESNSVPVYTRYSPISCKIYYWNKPTLQKLFCSF